jgi:hypothetical protein
MGQLPMGRYPVRHTKEITTLIESTQRLLPGTHGTTNSEFFCQHSDVCSWNYTFCLSNYCVASPPQDISCNQYACCLIYCGNLMCEGNMRQAWHVPCIAYCGLSEEISSYQVHVQNTLTEQVWLSNKVCDLYSGGASFRSWLEQQQLCRVSWFSSVSLGKCKAST